MTGLLTTATRNPLACLVTALLVTTTVLAACTAEGGGPDPAPSPSPPETSSAGPSEGGLPAPAPEVGDCHQLSYDAAVAPTARNRSVACDRTHTAETFHVGRFDNVVDGRLLAVDSDRVQRQIATACPPRLAAFVGGTEEQRRLSMLRAVWFTPTVAQSDAGALWFRCDAVALAEDSRLLAFEGSLAGVLETAPGRQRFGLCATAEPGTSGFRRVACGEPHRWRALRTVALEGRDYPGEQAVARTGETPCRDAALAQAADPLDFQWGYEWPTAEQWEAGQTWGVCWVPAPAT
ncbi:septum formation family protein [Nocardioides sp.]|uniref:septum formation family protein n=1 Tax=Nocardioides sp. TaxID=35761 RepID=UPI002ED3DDBD